MAARTQRLVWKMIGNTTGTDAFMPFTGWMAARTIEQVRVKWEIAAIGGGGTTTVTPAFQVADHTDSPGAVTNIGTGTDETTKDVFYPGGYDDIAATLASEQLIRFGFNVKSSSGWGWAMVGGSVDIIDL